MPKVFDSKTMPTNNSPAFSGAKTDGAKDQLREQHQAQSELVRAGDDFVGRREHAGVTAGQLELGSCQRICFDELDGAVDDIAQRVALVIVKKKSQPAMLKIIIDPAVEIAGLATMFGDHENAAHLIA